MSEPRVIVAESDRGFRELLEFILLKEGYLTTSAPDGQTVIDLALEGTHDVVVVSAELPGTSGTAVCRELRRLPATERIPIIVITSERDRGAAVSALEAGADDFLSKPFKPRMLLEKLGALLGVSGAASDDVPRKIGDLLIDERKHEVQVAGQFVDLTPTEFHILTVLADNAGRPLSRRYIVKATKGWANVTERSVDFHIVGLRKKLETSSDLIETVRGIGYRLRDRVKPRSGHGNRRTPRRPRVREEAGTA